MNRAETSNPAPSELRIGGPAWDAATKEGHDMSLIEGSLAQPVWERLQTHQSALSFALMLREAGEKLRGGSQ